MSVKDRLKIYIKHKNISVSAFERSINVSNGYVNGVYKTIGSDKRDLIVQEYPDLNIDWLLNGAGEMLLQKPLIKEKPSYTSTDGFRDKHIEKLEWTIAYLEDKIARMIKES